VVGASYFAGALVPVVPVLAGATTVLASVLTAGNLIAVVSMVRAFLSRMEMKRRVVTNLVTITAAVPVTFVIGLVPWRVWGVSV
jgi:VIT1/CCC1 family predicted Fe2+/Mn2+ transporter